MLHDHQIHLNTTISYNLQHCYTPAFITCYPKVQALSSSFVFLLISSFSFLVSAALSSCFFFSFLSFNLSFSISFLFLFSAFSFFFLLKKPENGMSLWNLHFHNKKNRLRVKAPFSDVKEALNRFSA